MSFIGETLMEGGINWIDYWNKVPGKIFSYPIPANYPHNPIIYRTVRSHASERILLLGLMTDYAKSAIVPTIYLRREKILKTNLSKSRGEDSILRIYNLSYLDLQKLRAVLDSVTSSLINKCGTKPIILYTDWYMSNTGFIYDFLEGNIVQLCHNYTWKKPIL